jgi:hypothetical protein
VPYEVGMAHYREIARGQIIGDTTGRLKLIFHSETGALLGVHVIGEGATELIHIGQAVMALGGTVRYFVDHVFNYPTLAECYKVAAPGQAQQARCRGRGQDRRRSDAARPLVPPRQPLIEFALRGQPGKPLFLIPRFAP